MNPDKKLIYSELEKIKESSHFNKSRISCDLLDYLTKTSLEGKNPKEYTIGIELFGKKYAEDHKQDSKIRVYIHNLRKKLTDYYESDGAKAPIIFEVEKGKYHVKFIPRKQRKRKVNFSYKLAFFISATACLLLVISTFFVQKTTIEKPWNNLPIWKTFAESDKPTLLVIGDYFVFNGMLPTGKMGVFRDFSINSEVDYEHLLDKRPELVKEISKSPLTYLSKMSVFCQNNIQQVFGQMKKDIHVKLSSDIQPDDLKSYNIIYIGNFKNMGLFENIVKDLDVSFGVQSGNKQYTFGKNSDVEIYKAMNSDLKQNDYSLVIFTEGYADNQYLFFLSTQDIGNISTVNQFTNPDYLQELYQQNQNILSTTNFKALFKVEGIDKTDLGFELVRLE